MFYDLDRQNNMIEIFIRQCAADVGITIEANEDIYSLPRTNLMKQAIESGHQHYHNLFT